MREEISQKYRHLQSDDTEWAWMPAQLGSGMRPMVVVGALVIMAVSCLSAGFVIGRLTTRQTDGHVVKQADKGAIPAPVTASAAAKQPERDAVMSPRPAPSVAILNPGTADAAKREDVSAQNTRETFIPPREPESSVKRLPADRNRGEVSGGGEAGSGTERDYRALRSYMVSR